MTFGQTAFSAFSVSMKSAPGTTFVLCPASAQFSSHRFLPQFCYIRLRSMTGSALSTSPTMRVGTNGTHDNICPAFTPPTSIAVEAIGSMPLTSPLSAPPVDTSSIVFEITASAVGPTTMLADVLLTGILIG